MILKAVVKTLKILCGTGLLIAAIGGGVGLCLSSSVAFKSMIVEGTPVVCPIGDTQVKVPGRIVALIIFCVPLGAALGGYFLLSSALGEESEPHKL